MSSGNACDVIHEDDDDDYDDTDDGDDDDGGDGGGDDDDDSDGDGAGIPVFRQKPEFRPWQFIFRPYMYVLVFFVYKKIKRVRNLAVSKEPWDMSEVIRDKPQKKYSSRATSAAEKACLSRMTPN